MNILQKEEISLIEELKKLEQEKTLFIYQSKRQFEEDQYVIQEKIVINFILLVPDSLNEIMRIIFHHGLF